MKVVGIRQLKAHLSEYLRLARSGETVLVTDRDEAVAEIGPVRRSLPASSPLDETLETLGATGSLRRAAVSKGAWAWSSSGLGLPAGTAARILGDLRQERD